MCETLGSWHKNSLQLLCCIQERLDRHKAQADASRAAQSALDAQVESVKATLRAQQDAQGDSFGDYDVGMDFDDDKMRKSGRSNKSKHGIGVGPRK